jgi:hypothetical protein
MARYAEDTQVSVEQSEIDVKRILRQHGASTVGTIEANGRARIFFEMRDRRIMSRAGWLRFLGERDERR